MKQPFQEVELAEDKQIIILNENQIVSIKKSGNDTLISMSNGQEYTVSLPKWDAWVLDAHIRKE